jgi:hypothetical protein
MPLPALNARPSPPSSHRATTAVSASSLTVPLQRSTSAETIPTTQTVKADFASADISPKLKALLAIAGKVQQGGKHVTPKDIGAARAQGQLIVRSTIRSSLLRPSACSTDMSMASRPGDRRSRRL